MAEVWRVYVLRLSKYELVDTVVPCTDQRLVEVFGTASLYDPIEGGKVIRHPISSIPLLAVRGSTDDRGETGVVPHTR